MLEGKDARIISTYFDTFFLDKIQQKPNFIYPGVAFDPVWREENNIKMPGMSDPENLWDMPGVYAFFEPYNQRGEIEIMYVGRSKTLRNRLSQHWRGDGLTQNSNPPLQKWFNYCWDNNYPFCPYVAIFVFEDDIKELEFALKHYLKPRFNVH